MGQVRIVDGDEDESLVPDRVVDVLEEELSWFEPMRQTHVDVLPGCVGQVESQVRTRPDVYAGDRGCQVGYRHQIADGFGNELPVAGRDAGPDRDAHLVEVGAGALDGIVELILCD